jgi:hypothetical protein
VTRRERDPAPNAVRCGRFHRPIDGPPNTFRRLSMNAMLRRVVAATVTVLAAGFTAGGLAAAKSVLPAATTTRRLTPAWAATDSVALREIVKYLADPAREGRGVGTAGIDSAAAYLARDMRRSGLRAGGDSGSYLQRFEVTTGAEPIEPCRLEVAGRTFSLGDQFQPLGFSTNGTLRGPVVFAGYGITAPGYDYDDYARLDVKDKIVLVLTNEPGEMDSTSTFEGSVNTPESEVRTKAINAREHGAMALLIANGPKFHAGEPPLRPKAEGAGYMSGGLLAAFVGDGAAAALVGSGPSLLALQESIERDSKPHSVALGDTAIVTTTLRRQRARIANVVGWMLGRDTTRTIVVGAHYDHLGYGGEHSLTPDARVPHLGADDNASGTAALVAVERTLASKFAHGWRPRHTLVFCSFTGEEMGLVGSGHYVDDPLRPLETVETMINMDMVGRLRDNRLMVMGVGTAVEFPSLVANANRAAGFDLKTSQDGYGPSDHSSFYKKKLPVLFLFTGAHADYHKPSDTWDKLYYQGIARVSGFVTALVESLDARPKPTFQQAKADSTTGRIAGGGGYGAYLGTIPDYLQTEGGVLLSGVRDGSPAARAGLQAGDDIVKFDEISIGNIYDYTFALRSRKPGQQVRITVKRGGQDVTLIATLGRRP